MRRSRIRGIVVGQTDSERVCQLTELTFWQGTTESWSLESFSRHQLIFLSDQWRSLATVFEFTLVNPYLRNLVCQRKKNL